MRVARPSRRPQSQLNHWTSRHLNRRPRINLNSVPITYTSNEQVEVYRFSLPAAILIPLVAVFLQAFVPLRFHFFSIFDLPLLVVIFFAVARRSPVAGLLTGAAIGLLQDSLPATRWGCTGSPRRWSDTGLRHTVSNWM